MQVGRRGFLRGMIAAPMALPVAAKDVAAKMGLSSLTAAPGADDCPDVPCELMTCSDGDVSSLKWYRQNLKDLFSSERVAQRRRHARRLAYRLDPDLAAHVSLSPAAAHQIQAERNYQRLTEEEEFNLNCSIKKLLDMGI